VGTEDRQESSEMAASAGRTKFVIPPFRQSQAMDEDYANRTWQTLHNAIQEIHRQNASGLSFEELYRNAYNMVLHKFGDKLYNGLVETITLHLRTVAAEVHAATDGDFLPQLRKTWEKHRLSSIMIRDILMYMDRTYVVAQKKVPVFERGLQVFRDEVCRHPKIKERLLRTLLGLIHRERCNETIERGLIKAATGMLLELGHEVYARDFEAPVLAATAEFYRQESNEYISQNSGEEGEGILFRCCG
jgi:cullin 3